MKIDKISKEKLWAAKRKSKENFESFGYPTKSFPYESLYDLKTKKPIFRKSENSTCFYCAGYYLLLIGNCWKCVFCPKLTTTEKILTIGPFKTKSEALKGLYFEKPRTT